MISKNKQKNTYPPSQKYTIKGNQGLTYNNHKARKLQAQVKQKQNS